MVPNRFKNAAYLTIRAAFREHPEWDEILRLSDKGEVVDGGSSTPFWFDGKKVLVPPLKLGGLESVTRKKIIQLCRNIGVEIVEKAWKPSDVFQNGELFFGGSGVGVMRASHLQNRKINSSSSLSVRIWQHYRKWAIEMAF
jgi:branched-chain amino acid aminotransferase